jgi:GNAT superfamily N-acetyltransferase
MSPVFRFSANMAVLYGEGWATSADMEGVALWQYSWKMICPPWRWLSFGGLDIRRCLGREAYRELTRISLRIDQARDRVAPDRYLYLSNLGVKPGCRRQGMASMLVKARVERAAKEGLSTMVETNTSEALAFYRSIGFRVLSSFSTAGLEYYVLQYPSVID